MGRGQATCDSRAGEATVVMGASTMGGGMFLIGISLIKT